MEQKSKHSPIGASSYKRWKNCPGSVRLVKTMDAVTTEFAEEGTEAHDLAYRMLCAKRDKKPAPDLMEYDDEMLDHVMMYVDHMVSLKRPGCIQLYEHKFHLKKIHPLCFGTADGVTYYPDQKLLIISDLKYGAGVYVDVEKNDQLLYYATGAALSLPWPIHRIRIEIIQPRIRHAEAIRPWECDIFDLIEFSEQLESDARATEDPNAPLCAGEWCTFCPAAPLCPLLDLKAKVLLAAEARGEGEDDIAKLAADLKWASVLEAMLRRKREYAYAQAEKGIKIPGWKLVEKRGKRDWVDPEDAGTRLRFNGYSADMIHTVPKAPELLSPAKIEALPIKGSPFKTKKELKQFVASLVDTKSSGHKLVLDAEEGDEVKPVTASTVFSSLRDEIDELN